MPLILAIEPDRRQSSKLAMIARNQLHADLIVADSVEQALAALDEHVPDLLLTSPLIPATDGAALTDRLRELDADGLHVQTVVIPALAVPGQRLRTPQKGTAAPVRGRTVSNLSSTSQGGCDPVVFGMQLSKHLDRAGAERPGVTRALSVVPQITRATARVTINTASPRTETSRTEVPRADQAKHPGAEQGLLRPDWSEVLSAMRREIEEAQIECEEQAAQASQVEETASVAAALPAVVHLAIAPPASAPQADAAPAMPEPAVAAANGPQKKKRRKTPRQDEWGFFDPQQCGVSALIAKVNEITGKTGGPAKKPV